MWCTNNFYQKFRVEQITHLIHETRPFDVFATSGSECGFRPNYANVPVHAIVCCCRLAGSPMIRPIWYDDLEDSQVPKKIRLGGDFFGWSLGSKYHPQIHRRWKLGASSSLKSTFMGQFLCMSVHCQELWGSFSFGYKGRWECMKLWMERKVCDMNQMRYVDIFHADFTYIHLYHRIHILHTFDIDIHKSTFIYMCVMIDECMWCARVIHLLCSCLLSNSLRRFGHWVPHGSSEKKTELFYTTWASQRKPVS